LKRVNQNWSPERIKSFCEETDDWVLELDDGLGPEEIKALYARQVASHGCYEGLVAEVAGDARTPEPVLRDIARRFQASTEILASLATNLATPTDVLDTLLGHTHPMVVEHARALRRQRG